MFGSTILEVAIGLIVVFIMVGAIVSAIREGIEARLKTRAAYLEQGIRHLLFDKDGVGLAKLLYEHPLIDGMYTGTYAPGKDKEKPSLFANGDHLPSYITAQNFARALMDIAARGPQGGDVSGSSAGPITLDAIKANVALIQNPKVERIIMNAVNTAEGDLNKVQTTLENWFNSGMDRVSGWYKRSTQKILFFIALITTIVFNVNAIKVGNYLAKDEAARALVVAKAETIKAAGKTPDNTNDAQKQLDELNLPIGWENGKASLYMNKEGANVNLKQFTAGGWWNVVWGPLFGWLITALAAMLGAPFWFDMLNKVMTLRSAIKPAATGGSAAGGATPPTSPQAPVVVNIPATAAPALPTDNDNTADSCCGGAVEPTSDEDLPESKGGTQ